jgi:integrase
LPRDSFEDGEILDLLRLPLFTGCHSRSRCWTKGKVLVQGSLYWQYLILLMTGMRPGEVAPLRTSDIGIVDAFAYFDLRPFNARQGRVELSQMRTLKTGNAARLVPINPLLIELGLLEHRDAMVKAGSDRLLPDCEPYYKPGGQARWSQEITKSWQYVKNRLNVVGRQDVTLYSTRHTMAQWIDALNLPERTRRRMLGHADGSQAATNYGSKGLLTLDEFKVVSGISNALLDQVREILLPPKHAADRGELTLVRPTSPPPRKAKQE